MGVNCLLGLSVLLRGVPNYLRALRALLRKNPFFLHGSLLKNLAAYGGVGAKAPTNFGSSSHWAVKKLGIFCLCRNSNVVELCEFAKPQTTICARAVSDWRKTSGGRNDRLFNWPNVPAMGGQLVKSVPLVVSAQLHFCAVRNLGMKKKCLPAPLFSLFSSFFPPFFPCSSFLSSFFFHIKL